jgi:hypothetical protein
MHEHYGAGRHVGQVIMSSARVVDAFSSAAPDAALKA